jgi:transcriptional regulator with XRE-family HTH domain
MQTARFGALVRAVRIESGLRQVDVAARARVSQQTLSRIERGDSDRLQVSTLESVARALGIVLDLNARWRGASGDRLLDRAHAGLVERTVATLTESGWQVGVEYSFKVRFERGVVDVLGWREDSAALLIVEVKSRLVDLQDLLGTLDRKVRIVPAELRRERRWRTRKLGVVVVMPESSASRDAVGRHGATFAAAFPGRNREVVSWLKDPRRDLRAVWFLRPTLPGSRNGQRTVVERVREHRRAESPSSSLVEVSRASAANRW